MTKSTFFFGMFMVLPLFFFATLKCNALHAQDTKMAVALFPTRAVLLQHTFDPVPFLIKFDGNASTSVSFDIPIPGDDWRRMPTEKISNEMTILAGFVHPKGPDHGMIQVKEYHPPYEMGPNDWLLWTLEQGKMKIVATAGEGLAGPGPYFEALAASELTDDAHQEPIMMRAAVFRNGKSFIVVQCMASPESYLNMAYSFGLAIHRFELHEMKPPLLIGQWDKYCLHSFCYTGPMPGPTSATSADDAIKEDTFPLALEGNRTGLLDITEIGSPLAQKTPAKIRINNILYILTERQGMSFNQDLVAFKGEHQNLGGDAYYARNEGLGADETAISFFAFSWERDGKALLVYMLTDAREKNPVAWMVNKRTFEIITQSLSRKSKTQ